MSENAQASAIHTPNGIEESAFVPIGGIDQWVQIRGEDRNNPVLLFVHGGPGATETYLSSLFRPWERYFTVVMWDQRCAGKTFGRNPASCDGLSSEGVARDGIELAEYLETHLHKHNIIVLGHSWGTMVGAHMIHDRPDLFSAYVATGEVVAVAEKETIIYARTLERLRQANDVEGLRKLSSVHPPSPDEVTLERELSMHHDIPSERDLFSNMAPIVLFAPGWSPLDIYRSVLANKHANEAAADDVNRYDVRKLGLDIQVPFFLFNGAEDTVTPTDLARAYFDSVRAPQKEFVSFAGYGHSAVLTAPDLFLLALLQRVRPVAVAGEASR